MSLTKQLIRFLCLVLLIFSTPITPVFAEADRQKQGSYETKDEVIYGKLSPTGKPKDIYVVNRFEVTNKGRLTDYGQYKTVRNLSDLSDVTLDDDGLVSFEASDESFYYQGELKDTSLPWNVEIVYLIDGKQVNEADLAGKSGSFEIQIKTSQNEALDPVFFENYLLQISVTLDPYIFTDIIAPKGTEVNVGTKKQINFMVLPDEEENFILTGKVKDFELDPVEISAVPANIAIDDPDLGEMTGDMDSLSSAIRDINRGVGSLSSGVAELNDGVKDLHEGSASYQSGMNELSGSSSALRSGSKEILSALQQVRNELEKDVDLPDLGEIKQLPEGLRELATGLNNSAKGLDELRKNVNQANQALKTAVDQIEEGSLTEEEIAALYESDADKETIDTLVQSYKQAQTVKHTYGEVAEAFTALPSGLEQISTPLKTMASTIETTATEIENNLDDFSELDDLSSFVEGMSSLATEYKSFHEGLVGYTNGVDSLAKNYAAIDGGIGELANGTSTLTNGVSELHDGTKQLHDETKNLSGDMEAKVEEFMEDYDGSDFEPTSYVSDKNKQIDVVQFVLKTEGIEIEEDEVEQEETVEKKNMWQRLLDLFR